MRKIIFLDVDGTLVGHGGQVSLPVIEAIQAVRKNGHFVFLCTGRNRAGIRHLLDIGFDGIICSAGGYVEVNGEMIHSCCISERELKEAREVFDKHHVLYNLEATHMTFQSEEMSRLFVQSGFATDQLNSEMERLINEQRDTYNIESMKVFDAHPMPIHKLCFIAGNMMDLEEPKKILSDRFHFIIHEMFSKHTINGEIISKQMDKGKAVRIVADYLGIPLADTIGFGDSMNDFEMIQTCGLGIVMGNGSEELKQYADMICESVVDNGVSKALKRLGFY